ncbi:ribonuclease H-like protein [Hypomontagnella submonticulosa]|nr:ribonuclease H-like protein [Hypomontagnella submonticulosa]
MTPLGSSEVVGNALRSSKALRASLALRHWLARKSRMTATPPKHQLWHPTRGISFSPVARSPNLAPQDAQASNGAAVAANQGHRVMPRSNDLDASSLYPKLEGLSLSTLGRHVPNLDGAASDAADTVDEKVGVASADKPAISSEAKIPSEPPVAALPYKIVDGLFYAAKKATAGSTESFWSYTQYRGAAEDGTEQKVKVHYCRSAHTMERVCKEYFMGEKVLGFDLEWAADTMKWQGLKRNVSLIQLASPSRIGLFHLALFADKDDMVGPSFRAIMEDENITKVGVAIKGDTTRLRNYLDIDSKGLLELSHLYKLVTYSAEGRYNEINKRLVPLATQVEQYLRLPLYKGQDVRSSDWTKPLNMDQVIYSASDAYAGLQLYATLEHHRKQLDPCPPIPHHAERNLPIRLADGVELATTDDPVVDATEEKDLEAAPAKPRTSSSKPQTPKDSRVEIAEDRVTCYKAAHPQARATFVQLRAYYMWHDQGLEPQTIAQLLRDPPLKTNTVVGYILWAIQLERLPVDGERLRQEIAGTMADGVLRSRWPVAAAAVAVPSS